MLRLYRFGDFGYLMTFRKHQRRSHWGARGGHDPPSPPTLISELNKVQHFQFQTSGILFFTSVQKLYAPEISRFLSRMLQFLDNFRQLAIF